VDLRFILRQLVQRIKAAACLVAFFFFLMTPAEAALQAERPGAGGDPDRITFRVFVIDVDEIDSAEQNFTANFLYSLSWMDPRQAHDGEHGIIRDVADVWMPSIQVVNQQKLWRTFPEVVRIEPDGTASYRQRFWGQLSQPLRLQDFPFDTHDFVIQFVAAGNLDSGIEFVQDPAKQSGISEVLSIADYKVIDSGASVKGYVPLPGDEPLAGFRFKFTAERESGYYVIKVIIPLLLIIAMSWVVFWIDPTESGTQIGVATTTMLTLIAYRFAMGHDLPQVSYLTRMDHFILVATILVFVSLLEVIITSYMAKIGRLKSARWTDRVARVLIPGTFIFLTLRAFVM
jgi:hypothetical protein